MEFKCPKCGKVTPSTCTDKDGKKQFNSKFFPFCSERCKLIDMGAWFDGDYSIASEDSDQEQDFPPNDL